MFRRNYTCLAGEWHVENASAFSVNRKGTYDKMSGQVGGRHERTDASQSVRHGTAIGRRPNLGLQRLAGGFRNDLDLNGGAGLVTGFDRDGVLADGFDRFRQDDGLFVHGNARLLEGGGDVVAGD